MARVSRGVAAATVVWGARNGLRVCSSAAALSFDSGLHSEVRIGSGDGNPNFEQSRDSFNEGNASTSGRTCYRGTSLLSREASGTPEQVSLHYARHGTEFLLGLRGGSRQDVERVKSRLTTFLATELHLDVTSAPHTHIQAGKVLFLGTELSGLLDNNKASRRFGKEIEKRRRSKARAQGEARIRTEAWHSELKDVAVQAWSFGLKKARNVLESNELLRKKSLQVTKFQPEELDRSVARGALQRLLDKEEEIFMNPPGFLPQQILRAHHRLSKLLKNHLAEEENQLVATKSHPTRPPASAHVDDGLIPIRILAPMEEIMEKLSVKGILQPSKALPTVVTPLVDLSDEAIISYFAALGGCLLQYYRCCDNVEKIRRLVDHQVRWTALFTLGRKHGCSARKIIRRFSRGPRVVDPEDGSVVVEFPSSLEIARTGKKFLARAEVPSLDDVLRARPVQLRPGREVPVVHVSETLNLSSQLV